MSDNKRKFKQKATRRYLARQLKHSKDAQEDALLDNYIIWAEDKITVLAKWDTTAPKFAAIEKAHEGYQQKSTTLVQKGKELAHKLSTKATRAFQKMFNACPRVRFAPDVQVCTFNTALEAITVTYNSGADGNYVSKQDRKKAGLPILRRSTRRVNVANGEVCSGTNVTTLPVPQLPAEDTKADTFDDFPHSFMSVGKTSNAGTISIFTNYGVTVHKEDNILITCKGKPILIEARDMHGRYRIPLVQRRGTWQPRKPSKKAREHFQQANSVYDLPSTYQAIKWTHEVCRQPVKSTWLAAVEAGNYVDGSMLTARNVKSTTPRQHKPQKDTSTSHVKTQGQRNPNQSYLRPLTRPT